MPFVAYFEERRYVVRLATYIGEFVDSDAVSLASLALFSVLYPFVGLWFFNKMEFWWRDMDFKVLIPLKENSFSWFIRNASMLLFFISRLVRRCSSPARWSG